jgi:hypothetical protein
MPAKGKGKRASPKKAPTCQCALSKASTSEEELGCGNCNRKMTLTKWKKVKQAEDKKWEAEVQAGRADGGGEAESDVTAGGKETPRGKETPKGDSETENEEEEEEGEEEVEEKKVGGPKKQARGATRGKDVVEEEEEEEQIEDEVAKDAGEVEGLVLLFCS